MIDGKGVSTGTRAARAILIACMFAAPGAQAEPCARADEQAALNTRVLQTELMIGALSCGYRTGYNDFVGNFRGDLVLQGGSLRGYFKRHYGRQAEFNLNRFITQLANEESTRSNGSRLEFCAASALLFQKLAGATPKDFGQLIADSGFAGRHRIPACAAVDKLSSPLPRKLSASNDSNVDKPQDLPTP